MTSPAINLAFLKSTLTADSEMVSESKTTTKLDLAMSFYLNKNLNLKVDTGLNTKALLVQALERTWQDKSTSKSCSF